MAPSVLQTSDLPVTGSLKVLEAEVNGSQTPTDVNHEEYQYLNLIREILESGEHRPDRYALYITAHSSPSNM